MKCERLEWNNTESNEGGFSLSAFIEFYLYLFDYCTWSSSLIIWSSTNVIPFLSFLSHTSALFSVEVLHNLILSYLITQFLRIPFSYSCYTPVDYFIDWLIDWMDEWASKSPQVIQTVHVINLRIFLHFWYYSLFRFLSDIIFPVFCEISSTVIFGDQSFDGKASCSDEFYAIRCAVRCVVVCVVLRMILLCVVCWAPLEW